MYGQSHAHRDSGDSQQFAAGIQQLLGEDFDLDPRFLEESWTLGLAVAMENWERRQRTQVERERESHAFRELTSFAAFNFIESDPSAADSLLADHAAAVARRYDASWSYPEPAATTLSAAAPVSHATPYEVPQYESAEIGPEIDLDFDPSEPMTQARACLLLEVAADTSRELLRSAYRRMVSRWHPDRLQLCTDEIRHYATQQMAAINEAYSLLRSSQEVKAA